MKNTEISPNFLVWKFCGKTQFPHSFGRFVRNYSETAFPQNFHTRKLGEITVFFTVPIKTFKFLFKSNAGNTNEREGNLIGVIHAFYLCIC